MVARRDYQMAPTDLPKSFHSFHDDFYEITNKSIIEPALYFGPQLKFYAIFNSKQIVVTVFCCMSLFNLTLVPDRCGHRPPIRVERQAPHDHHLRPQAPQVLRGA